MTTYQERSAEQCDGSQLISCRSYGCVASGTALDKESVLALRPDQTCMLNEKRSWIRRTAGLGV